MGARPVDYRVPSWRRRHRLLLRERGRITYANFIDRMAEVYGERTAFVLDAPIDYAGIGGTVLSYNDVARLVSRMAHGLQGLGVKRGDRVALITMNRIEMAFASFALGKLGAIPVPLNFMLSVDELDDVVRRAGVELVLCDRVVYSGVIGQPSRVPSVKRWAFVERGPLRDDVMSLHEIVTSDPGEVASVAAHDDDIAFIFFTSGTTGTPKGAALSHASAMVGPRHIAALSALRPSVPEHRALLVMPVAHVGGYAAMVHYLSLGWPIYFSSHFDPERILDVLERDRITVFTGSPAMYRMLLDAGANRRDLSSVEVWGGGADAFSDELVRTFRDMTARRGRFRTRKAKFIRGYGMAEANSYVTQSPPFPAGDGCLGWVLPPVKARVVDEDGRDVDRGQAGELWISGPSIMKGYWDDPVETRNAIIDGWFRTGDTVRRGRWGVLYFVDRSRDIIKSGGYKISAVEVDQALLLHSAVEHVATIGVPDDSLGERVVSVVVLRPGATASAEQIIRWARSRLSLNKCPREVVIVDALPLTFTLKPKRREVREQLLARQEALHPVRS